MEHRKNILIVGGGIAGTTLAYLLQEQHNITLVEKSSGWRTIGYGVGVWRNGLEILRKLPLSPEFWASCFVVNQGAVLSAKGDILMEGSFGGNQKDEPSVFTFEREVIHNAIHSLLTEVKVRFSTNVKSISQTASTVEVEFSDGQRQQFDFVVGADGLRSTVRSLVFGDKLRDYGWDVWGAWAPSEVQPFQGYYVMGGRNESLIGFPYRGKSAVGFMYRTRDTDWPKPPRNAQEIFDKFPLLKDWVQKIVPTIDDPSTMFADRLQYVAMNEWYKGRVILIGDARHAMSLLTGMGVSLALEDAWVFAEELNQNADIEKVFRNFVRRREIRLKSIRKFRTIVEKLGMINSRFREMIRDTILKNLPAAFSGDTLRKIFETKI